MLGYILWVLSNDVRCQIVERVRGLAVQQKQVGKRLWREGRALEEEVQLLKAPCGVSIHVEQRAVVKADLDGFKRAESDEWRWFKVTWEPSSRTLVARRANGTCVPHPRHSLQQYVTFQPRAPKSREHT